jgi:putative membrane protein
MLRDARSMTDQPSDPRVFFAAERTLLAWLRTGIAIMAFGFVVARFALFLRLLDAQAGSASAHAASPYLGAVLVVLGAIATAGGAIQFRRFYHTIPIQDRPTTWSPSLSMGLSWLVVVIGAVLSVAVLL